MNVQYMSVGAPTVQENIASAKVIGKEEDLAKSDRRMVVFSP